MKSKFKDTDLYCSDDKSKPDWWMAFGKLSTHGERNLSTLLKIPWWNWGYKGEERTKERLERNPDVKFQLPGELLC